MSQYSSGKHEKITADPYPWLHSHVSENCRDTGGRFSFNNGVGNVYVPRPEFDRPLVNPANPILEDVRLQEPHMVDAQIRYWMGSVPTHVVATLPEGYWYTAAHLKHARTVLTRLAKFKEATS